MIAEPHIPKVRDPEQQELYTFASTARKADCSIDTVRRLVKAGRLRVVYVSDRSPRVPREELQKLLGGAA